MAIIILLNVVFAALVVGGILTLLSWGIAADRRGAVTLSRLRGTRRRRSAQPVLAPLHQGA